MGSLEDNFAGTGPLSAAYTNYNPGIAEAVGRVDSRYRFELTDNTGNRSTWFDTLQGEGFFKSLSFFPGTTYSWIYRNVGIGQTTDSQTPPVFSSNPYTFCGCNIHVDPLSSTDYLQVVVGYRGASAFGGTERTVEFKKTIAGSSSVDDAGLNALTGSRADLLFQLTRNGDGTTTCSVGWQEPNLTYDTGTPDSFTPYDFTGTMPAFGDQIWVGPVTYAFELNGLPFVGTIDRIQASVGQIGNFAAF